MLLQIKSLFENKNQLSLTEVCKTLAISPQFARVMLARFVQKGDLRVCRKENACGKTCVKCVSLENELYEWISV